MPTHPSTNLPPLRHLAPFALAFAALACSSSSDGGGSTSAPAQSTPSGSWIVNVNESSNCSGSDSSKAAIVITVSGNTVTIRDLFDGNSASGTLVGRELPSTTGTLDGVPPLSFSEGFTTFTGSASQTESFDDGSGGSFTCTQNISVNGRRVACTSVQTGNYGIELFKSDGSSLFASPDVLSLAESDCALEGTLLAGVVDGRTFTGRIFNSAGVNLDLASGFVDRIQFSVQLGDPGQVATGTWTATIKTFDSETFSESTSTVSGSMRLTPPEVVVTPPCEAVQEGIWDFTFGTVGGFQGNLSQNGCSIVLDTGASDRFAGTLVGTSLNATGEGFFAGESFSGSFSNGGTRFDGTGNFAGQSGLTVVGVPSDPGGDGGDGGGGDPACPAVSSSSWSFDGTVGGSPAADFGGGTFSLSSSCELSYSSSKADGFGGVTTTSISGPLDASGQWTATGTITITGFGAPINDTIDLTATFSGDPATSFSGSGSMTLFGSPLAGVSFSGSAN